MNNPFNLKHSLLVATLLVSPLAQSATTSQADYATGKSRISADFKADKTACSSLAGNAKDICVEEAIAKEKVARAELDAGHTGTAADRNKVLVVKAESGYAVAKEKCDDLAGNAKDVCVKEAKAVEVKALTDAKVGKQIGEATASAAEDKRDAEYKVAAEKCDAMSGDAKAGCLSAAKAKFGKS
jgi:hypothetical protein